MHSPSSEHPRSSGKDKLVSVLARPVFDRLLRDYGKLERLKIDSQRKTMAAGIHLHGDHEGIDVDILGYRIESREKEHFFVVEGAKANRPWFEKALENFVVGKEFPIPSKFGGIVKKLI